MPVAATGVTVSGDGQYIFGTGVYKPRVRCYDLTQLAMKFERCVDAEIVHFSLLSEDYTKVTLQPVHFQNIDLSLLVCHVAGQQASGVSLSGESAPPL